MSAPVGLYNEIVQLYAYHNPARERSRAKSGESVPSQSVESVPSQWRDLFARGQRDPDTYDCFTAVERRKLAPIANLPLEIRVRIIDHFMRDQIPRQSNQLDPRGFGMYADIWQRFNFDSRLTSALPLLSLSKATTVQAWESHFDTVILTENRSALSFAMLLLKYPERGRYVKQIICDWEIEHNPANRHCDSVLFVFIRWAIESCFTNLKSFWFTTPNDERRKSIEDFFGKTKATDFAVENPFSQTVGRSDFIFGIQNLSHRIKSATSLAVCAHEHARPLKVLFMLDGFHVAYSPFTLSYIGPNITTVQICGVDVVEIAQSILESCKDRLLCLELCNNDGNDEDPPSARPLPPGCLAIIKRLTRLDCLRLRFVSGSRSQTWSYLDAVPHIELIDCWGNDFDPKHILEVEKQGQLSNLKSLLIVSDFYCREMYCIHVAEVVPASLYFPNYSPSERLFDEDSSLWSNVAQLRQSLALRGVTLPDTDLYFPDNILAGTFVGDSFVYDRRPLKPRKLTAFSGWEAFKTPQLSEHDKHKRNITELGALQRAHAEKGIQLGYQDVGYYNVARMLQEAAAKAAEAKKERERPTYLVVKTPSQIQEPAKGKKRKTPRG